MKLEHQVCNWEQGRRLNELGIKAPSYFTWMRCDLTNDGDTFNHWWAVFRPNNGEFDFMTDMQFPDGYESQDEFNTSAEYPAYTVAELGVMLPDYYPSWRFEVVKGGPKKWIATVICEPKPPGIDNIHTAHEFDRHGYTQAEALATLLIALLETETITPESVNERLQKS